MSSISLLYIITNSFILQRYFCASIATRNSQVCVHAHTFRFEEVFMTSLRTRNGLTNEVRYIIHTGVRVQHNGWPSANEFFNQVMLLTDQCSHR